MTSLPDNNNRGRSDERCANDPPQIPCRVPGVLNRCCIGSRLAAWCRSLGQSSDDATLARFGRLLFPHEGLADEVYAEVMDHVLMSLATISPSDDVLMLTEQALNHQQDASWFDLDETAQIKAIENIQGEAYFAAVLGTLRGTFYNHPAVWAHLHYPGSSKEHGGYKFRGFDDIDWLPERR